MDLAEIAVFWAVLVHQISSCCCRRLVRLMRSNPLCWVIHGSNIHSNQLIHRPALLKRYLANAGGNPEFFPPFANASILLRSLRRATFAVQTVRQWRGGASGQLWILPVYIFPLFIFRLRILEEFQISPYRHIQEQGSNCLPSDSRGKGSLPFELPGHFPLWHAVFGPMFQILYSF